MIRQVITKAELLSFIEFPHDLYAGDAHYVPQLNLMQRQLLSPKHNPFFQHSEAAYFLALDARGRVQGRIAAIHNRAHLDIYHDNTGFFGFFDCIDDVETAGALLDAAAGWLRARGLTRMIGPENLTTNDSVGILTEGFDEDPMLLMPYNYPYYARLLEKNGLHPVLELLSYHTQHDTLPPDLYEKATRLEQRLAERGIRLRPIDFKNFDADTAALRPVYNAANADNWGFLPLNEQEFRHMANDLRQLVLPDNVWLVEQENRLIGYGVSVPNYNRIFKKIPRGRLLPWGWWHLLTGKRHIDSVRVMILGVLPEYRRMGIDWCLYARIAEAARRRRIPGGEACYVMDVNTPMKRMMEALGGKVVKRYRVFGL